MFYYLSKIFWLVADPIDLTAILLAIGLLALFLGWRRLGATLATAALGLLLLATWTTFGALLLRPLEDRFARPNPAPVDIAGIVVLGGGFAAAMGGKRRIVFTAGGRKRDFGIGLDADEIALALAAIRRHLPADPPTSS